MSYRETTNFSDNGIKPGTGEPVDLYSDPEFASDMEEWTAGAARVLDARAAEWKQWGKLTPEQQEKVISYLAQTALPETITTAD